MEHASKPDTERANKIDVRSDFITIWSGTFEHTNSSHILKILRACAECGDWNWELWRNQLENRLSKLPQNAVEDGRVSISVGCFFSRIVQLDRFRVQCLRMRSRKWSLETIHIFRLRENLASIQCLCDAFHNTSVTLCHRLFATCGGLYRLLVDFVLWLLVFHTFWQSFHWQLLLHDTQRPQ